MSLRPALAPLFGTILALGIIQALGLWETIRGWS